MKKFLTNHKKEVAIAASITTIIAAAGAAICSIIEAGNKNNASRLQFDFNFKTGFSGSVEYK